MPIAEVPIAEVPIAEEPIAEEPIAEVPIAEVPIAAEGVGRRTVREDRDPWAQSASAGATVTLFFSGSTMKVTMRSFASNSSR